MLEITLELAVALAVVFVINLVPAFMPSTWMVLAFFRIKYGLPLLALTISGAIVSALGRLLLARGSMLFTRRYLNDQTSDLQELGGFLEDHRQHVGLSVFLYTLSPLPTNNLFIAAGMVQLSIAWVLVGFLAGRLIADTLWVWAADRAFRSFGGLFTATFGSWTAIVLQIGSLVSVALLFRLPWAKWLRRYIRRSASRPSLPTA